MLSGMQIKEDAVPSAAEPLEQLSASQLTTITNLEEFVDYCAGLATKPSATPVTAQPPSSDPQSTSCSEDGDQTSTPSQPACSHHWLVSTPKYRYSKGRQGVLLEETTQVCKKCGETRTPEIVVAADWINE